jgi:hypothetical protein
MPIESPANHKAFLSVGDEVRNWTMRDNDAHETVAQSGVLLGQRLYWQVVTQPSVGNRQPARTIRGFKEAWEQDPITPVAKRRVSPRPCQPA